MLVLGVKQSDSVTHICTFFFRFFSTMVYYKILNIVPQAIYSRTLLGEVNIWIRRLNKADCPSPCGWASSSRLKPWGEQKDPLSHRKEGTSLCLTVFKQGHLSSAFRLRVELTLSTLLSLQLADYRSCGFSVSITAWATSLQQISLYIHHYGLHVYVLQNPRVGALTPKAMVWRG